MPLRPTETKSKPALEQYSELKRNKGPPQYCKETGSQTMNSRGEAGGKYRASKVKVLDYPGPQVMFINSTACHSASPTCLDIPFHSTTYPYLSPTAQPPPSSSHPHPTLTQQSPNQPSVDGHAATRVHHSPSRPSEHFAWIKFMSLRLSADIFIASIRACQTSTLSAK